MTYIDRKPVNGLWESVNGSWASQTKIPHGRHRIGSFADRAVEVQRTLADVLREDTEATSDSSSLRCLARSIEHARSDGLCPPGDHGRRLLTAVAAADSITALLTAFGEFQSYGLPTGVRILDLPEDDDADASVLLGKPLLPHYSAQGSTPERTALLSAVIDTTPASWGTIDLAHVEIVEELLGQLNITASQTSYIVTDFDDMFYELDAVSARAWESFFVAQTSSRPNSVRIPSGEKLQFWLGTIASVPAETWQSWLRLRLIWNAVILTGSRAFLAGSPAFAGAMDPIEFVMSVLPDEADAVYNSSSVSPDTISAARDIGQQVLSSTSKLLGSAPWLSVESQAASSAALNRIFIDVGPANSLLPPSASPDNLSTTEQDLCENLLALGQRSVLYPRQPPANPSLMRSTSVNASFLRTSNTIVVPAGLLAPPFFDLSGTLPDNLGALGALVGHEAFHLFDDVGPNGFTASWSEDERTALAQIRKSVANCLDGTAVAGHEDLTVNGHAVATETLADVVGLKAALAAGRASPDWRGASDDEALLHSWARMWRFACSTSYARRTHGSAVHAPAPLRCDFAAKIADENILAS